MIRAICEYAKSRKASGEGEIPAEVLRVLPTAVLEGLADITNKRFRGELHGELGDVLVTLLPK
eukprot:15117972-Alexandrium_andersonii.AAC.2